MLSLCLCALCVCMLCLLLRACMRKCTWTSLSVRLHVLPLPSPSGGQWGDGGPLRWDAADLHVGEGATCLAAAVGHRGGGGDDVLQSVEGDDEQRQQEHQQAEEEPHINVNVARTSWWWCGRRRGSRGWGETEESPIVYRKDSRLIVVYQWDVHPWHRDWCSAEIYIREK